MRGETVGDNKQKRQQTTKNGVQKQRQRGDKVPLAPATSPAVNTLILPGNATLGRVGSARLGFSNTSSFSSVFRKHVGLTPAEPAAAWNRNFLLHGEGGRAPIQR